MRTIAIVARKGGTGKSVTAQNLATILKREGNRVLLIDLDQQGSTTHTLKGSVEDATIYEVMAGDMIIQDAIQETPYTDLITADAALADLDTSLSGKGSLQRLKRALEKVKARYDYVILDTPPHLGKITLSAMIAADEVIIPALASVYSLESIKSLREEIEAVKEINPDLEIAGVLLTMFDDRNRIAKLIRKEAQAAAEALGTKVFETPIRRTVRVEEAQYFQKPLAVYAPNSTAALDYEQFVKELIGKDGNQ